MHTIMFTIGVSMIINPQAKSYLTDSYIVFILKMKSVSEIKNFWSKNDGEKWSRKKYF